MLHLIPDEDVPHAPTSECGCGPQLVLAVVDGVRRPVVQHRGREDDGLVGVDAEDGA